MDQLLMKRVPVKVSFCTIKENIHTLKLFLGSPFSTQYIFWYTKYNNSPNNCTAF